MLFVTECWVDLLEAVDLLNRAVRFHCVVITCIVLRSRAEVVASIHLQRVEPGYKTIQWPLYPKTIGATRFGSRFSGTLKNKNLY